MAVVSILEVDNKNITRYNNSTISNININDMDFNFAQRTQNEGVKSVLCDNSVAEPIYDIKVYGNSVQESVPNPSQPMEIESVGDYDETNNQYKISLKINNVITNIFLSEPLRKVGDYADYIDFKRGKIIRQIKQARIDQNSSFAKFGNPVNVSAFYMSKSDIIDYDTHKTVSVPILSNSFEYYPCGAGNRDDNWTSSYQISGSISTSYKRVNFTLPNTITDVTSAKAWLADNPINYFYPTSDVVEEDVDLPTLATEKGDNVVSIETKIKPTLLEVEYWRQVGAEKVLNYVSNGELYIRQAYSTNLSNGKLVLR